MSDCTRIGKLLLEAEPEELRGSADTEVGRHVRSCAGCRRAAEALLRGTAELDRVLAGAPAAPFDAAALVERSLAEAPTERAAARRAHRARGRRAGLGALAAAAALAALVLLRGDEAPAPGPEPRLARAAPPPLVESVEGDNVAVIETDDPDITVVWFF